MRQVLAVIAALIGGYLLWTALRFGRVMLILDDKQFDGTMMVITAVLAGVGLAFCALAWRLFRTPKPSEGPKP